MKIVPRQKQYKTNGKIQYGGACNETSVTRKEDIDKSRNQTTVQLPADRMKASDDKIAKFVNFVFK